MESYLRQRETGVDVLSPSQTTQADVFGRFMRTFADKPVEWDFEDEITHLPFCVKAAEQSDRFVVGDEDGFVSIVDGEGQVQGQHAIHPSAIFDVKWYDNDSSMLTASGDQTVKIFDITQQQESRSFSGHNASVKSVCAMNDSPHTLASGSRDGSIRYWDTRSKSSVAMSFRAHTLQAPVKRRRSSAGDASGSGTVSGVVFSRDDSMLISSGASDGVVKFWDMRNLGEAVVEQSCFCACEATGCQRTHGITHIDLSRDGSRILISSIDNRIYVCELSEAQLAISSVLSGHQSSSFYSMTISPTYLTYSLVRNQFSPDGEYVLSGSSDSNLYLWKTDLGYDNCTPMVMLGHTAEVNGVCWSNLEFGKFISTADDSTVRVWNVDASQAPQWVNKKRRRSEGSPRFVHPKRVPLTPVPSPGASRSNFRNPTLTELWH